MKILTFDLATKTGWCFAAAGDPVAVGTLKMPSTGDDLGWFLNHFERHARNLIDSKSPDLIVFESPILRSGKTTISTLRKVYGLAGVLEMIAGKRKIQINEVAIGTVKKQLAGNGHAKKPEMIAAARACGVTVKDDNEADAFGIFLCVISAHFPKHLAFYKKDMLL